MLSSSIHLVTSLLQLMLQGSLFTFNNFNVLDAIHVLNQHIILFLQLRPFILFLGQLLIQFLNLIFSLHPQISLLFKLLLNLRDLNFKLAMFLFELLSLPQLSFKISDLFLLFVQSFANCENLLFQFSVGFACLVKLCLDNFVSAFLLAQFVG